MWLKLQTASFYLFPLSFYGYGRYIDHQTISGKTAIFASVQGHEIIGVEADDVGDPGGKKIP